MFLNSLNIAGSALTAQRMRMDVISQNLSNVDTTNGADGQPYRRKTVTLSERTQNTFSGYLDEQEGQPGGVEVSSIGEDPTDFKLKYDPTNADANAQGYVAYPNVDTVTEMTDLMESSKSYSANITSFNALKSIAVTALQIGK
jgi:flagellar basal-body rod protein FlgC